MKRVLDLTLVVLLAPVWLPLLALTAMIVRIGMGAPVLFRQQRPGLHGRPFVLLKFRTMRVGTGPDSERLTPFGKWLRRTSLDELPQLWNVLRGEMALVGPRPLLMAYLPRYIPGQARRHEVRPGLTGWAQAQGRNAVSWEERLRYDTWYVDHQSLGLDLRILLLTVWQVVRGRGIAAEGQATMAEFVGQPDGRPAAESQEPETEGRKSEHV